MNPNSKDDEDTTEPTSSSGPKEKPNYPGPKSGVKYPLTVTYCGGLCNFFFNIILTIKLSNKLLFEKNVHYQLNYANIHQIQINVKIG